MVRSLALDRDGVAVCPGDNKQELGVHLIAGSEVSSTTARISFVCDGSRGYANQLTDLAGACGSEGAEPVSWEEVCARSAGSSRCGRRGSRLLAPAPPGRGGAAPGGLWGSAVCAVDAHRGGRGAAEHRLRERARAGLPVAAGMETFTTPTRRPCRMPRNPPR